MPERHLREYEAYYKQQPFGQWREDWRMSVIASTMTMGQLKKPLKPNQFMHFWDTEDNLDGESVEEIISGAQKV